MKVMKEILWIQKYNEYRNRTNNKVGKHCNFYSDKKAKAVWSYIYKRKGLKNDRVETSWNVVEGQMKDKMERPNLDNLQKMRIKGWKEESQERKKSSENMYMKTKNTHQLIQSTNEEWKGGYAFEYVWVSSMC